MLTKILAVLTLVVIGAAGTYVVSEGKCPFTGEPLCGSAEPGTAPCAACVSMPACCDETCGSETDANTTAKAAALGGCFVGVKSCPVAGCCGD
jgi:hypothetical protein